MMNDDGRRRQTLGGGLPLRSGSSRLGGWTRIAALGALLLGVVIQLSAQVHCEQPPEDWVPTRYLVDLTRQIELATALTPEQSLELRLSRANDTALFCQFADAVTTIVAIEWAGAHESNPVLSVLNSSDSTDRYLGYAAFLTLKWGLVRLARRTPTTSDDWVLSAFGCSAAAWNLYQITRSARSTHPDEEINR